MLQKTTIDNIEKIINAVSDAKVLEVTKNIKKATDMKLMAEAAEKAYKYPQTAHESERS